MYNVSVIGLGKLGACMAACFAARGFDTIGLDWNPRNVDCFNRGVAPVEEPDLAEMIQKGKGHLKATTRYAEAVLESEATFVIVPTPSEADGRFSLRHAREAFREIGLALKNKKGYHLVVLTSTVLPGGTEFGLLPILEEASGKKLGVDFGLCYSPEFIALGSVIRDFLNPDFVLIGESDSRAGELLGEFYKRVCDNDPPIARMSLANAELTKLAVNSFMTMKISFANMLAALCEQLPGGDVEVVTKALGLFGGVGKKSLTGGLGYGGPCLPRDNIALSYLAKSLEQDLGLPAEVDRFNRSLVDRVFEKTVAAFQPSSKISVLGLAYKPYTWVVEESQGLELARRLAQKGFAVTVYDPKAMAQARNILKESVAYATDVEQALAGADGVVITTPDPAFKNISSLLVRMGPRVVIDIWRLHRETLSQHPSIRYCGVGLGEETKRDRLKKIWV